MSQLIDFVLHFDKYLLQFVQTYGAWVYGILFAIIFAETGLVVAPFLPGDSLLFAVGALSATGVLNPWLCYFLLIVAAIVSFETSHKRLNCLRRTPADAPPPKPPCW